MTTPTPTYSPTAWWTRTPLLTSWTAPAACNSPRPTVFAGECESSTCSAYPAAQVTTTVAFVNDVIETVYRSFTSTECMPPGYLPYISFFFTGVACPTSWVTATRSSTAAYGETT